MGRRGKGEIQRGIDTALRESRSSTQDEIDDDTDDNVTITISNIDLRKIIKDEVDKVVLSLKADLAQRFDDTDSQLTQLNKLIKDMTQQLDFKSEANTINNKLKNMCTQVSAIKDVLNNQIKSSAESSTTHKQQLKSSIDELREKDDKNSNINIFNIPESVAASATDRKNDDIVIYKDICKSIDVEAHEIINIFRIGGKTEGKTRPLVVKSNAHIKNQILMNAKKMRHVADNVVYKKAVLKPDLIKDEQQQEKILISELKRRKALGEKVFIRRGKIETSTY
jgi:hypothetical protein